MAKNRDPFTRFSLKRDENGVWYAHDNWFPYIMHPDSWGSKEKAQNYIAGEWGISWEEYQAIKHRKSTRNQPKRRSPMSDREKLVELISSAEYRSDYTVGGRFYRHWIENIADHLIANGVTVQGAIRKAEDCRCYTATSYGGACLGTREIDPCKGDGCENWKPKEE